MRNKIKKRVNKYFGEGKWDKMLPEQKKVFIDMGAHEMWKQHKAKTLVSPEVPKRVVHYTPADIVPVELLAKPKRKGLFARLFHG